MIIVILYTYLKVAKEKNKRDFNLILYNRIYKISYLNSLYIKELYVDRIKLKDFTLNEKIIIRKRKKIIIDLNIDVISAFNSNTNINVKAIPIKIAIDKFQGLTTKNVK